MSDRDDLIEILRNTYRATQLGFIDAQADAILTRWRLAPNPHPAHDFKGAKDTECECWAEGYEKGWEDGRYA